MNVNTVKLAYFSPTGTTKRVLQGIAEGLGAETVRHIDLTPADASAAGPHASKEDLVVLGVPVYEGRVAKTAVPRLKRLTADNTPAVVVVVYGNRAYEDALLELGDMARELGFIPVAGGAFIGEHAFANEARPMANGRPDAADIGRAKAFGSDIRAKLAGAAAVEEFPPLELPGNTPYIDRDRSAMAEMAARTLEDACTLCGICEPLCPVGAITVEDAVETDNPACILCNACVKGCPEGARVVDHPAILKIVNWVCRNYQTRQEPQVFI